MAPESWSRAEVEATVADYRAMLALELQNEPLNKAEHNRNLKNLLDHRTPAAVEKKHQNISAIMIELGCPYIDGYKPLGNYQDLLFQVVEEQVADDAVLLSLMKRDAEAVAATPKGPASLDDILAALEGPPTARRRAAYLDRLRERPLPAPRLTYLALEASNASQGLAGEEWVLQFERARLIMAGKSNLAERIEWVSRDAGDHLGFDIRSFEAKGTDRFVEVKTTKHGKETPFYVTRNEVRVSRDHDRAYHLYRLFRFERGPRLFMVTGALDRSCVLDPMEYEARVG
jgi:hypothetical protein